MMYFVCLNLDLIKSYDIIIRWDIFFFMPENALFQVQNTEVSFDTSEENYLSYLQNGYFKKRIFGESWVYNEVKCR